MIFVILGTQKFQLNRLLRQMDEQIAAGNIAGEVFAQTGHSDYVPKHYKYQDFVNKEQFEKLIAEADLVVTHSGVGSIVTALKYGRPTVVYPRLSKYKEHVDDHQMEIAEAFERKGYVLCCREEDDLHEVLGRAAEYPFAHYESQTGKIVGLVKAFYEKVEHGEI